MILGADHGHSSKKIGLALLHTQLLETDGRARFVGRAEGYVENHPEREIVVVLSGAWYGE